MFIEERIPVELGYGTVGGPRFRTSVVELQSGHEQRVGHWSRQRRRYDFAVVPRNAADRETLEAWFVRAMGRLYGFRMRDPFDYSATDVLIGTGTGASASYQLRKGYLAGTTIMYRDVYKIVGGTFSVKVNGVAVGSGYTVNLNTGVLTISAASGANITASFEFDIAVRFDRDELEWEAFDRNASGLWYRVRGLDAVEVRVWS